LKKGALRYFEWVDQLGITDEPCIHEKKQTKILHQELRNSGTQELRNSGTQELRNSGIEGKFNIRTEEPPWEMSRSQSGQGWKAITSYLFSPFLFLSS
jgi:hypothetical protein